MSPRSPGLLSHRRYIPVLMAQAKIYWDLENYPMVEKLFKQSAEFCAEHDVWKLNVAHVFFMQVRAAEHAFVCVRICEMVGGARRERLRVWS